MKVVVTGGTGHMGRYVVHELASLGYEVAAGSRSGGAVQAPYGATAAAGVRGFALDIDSEGAVTSLSAELTEGSALVHLAAWHPPATGATGPKERSALLETNVHGTLRALEAARGRASVVVYASTFEVYGVPAYSEPVTEVARLEPISDYGATKLSGEDHLFAFSHEERIRAVALRLPAIYGPGEVTSRALPNFLRQVARGERPTIQGDGGDLRDQLHARDSARAVVSALRASVSGIYNIADGRPHSIADLAREALVVSGIGGDPTFAPRVKTRYDFHMSCEKARRELGFIAQITLRDGMTEELEWIRSAGRTESRAHG